MIFSFRLEVGDKKGRKGSLHVLGCLVAAGLLSGGSEGLEDDGLLGSDTSQDQGSGGDGGGGSGSSSQDETSSSGEGCGSEGVEEDQGLGNGHADQAHGQGDSE